MIKVKASQLKAVRERMASDQGGKCAICGMPFRDKPPLDPVCDHDHRTGAIRGILHRGCNSVLGKVENGASRYGVREIIPFCGGLAGYLRRHITNTTGLIYPTFKTADEKREARNAKARRTRAAAKAAKET